MNKYICNKLFFEKINTEEKAYWLGFLYADGCVYLRDRYRQILSLNIVDLEHINKFKQSINSNHKIYHCNNMIGKHLFQIQINSKKICEDLIKLGCLPRKTSILEFPNEEQVSSNLLNHFIRGYLDGDGCIYHNQKQHSISILGTYNFLFKLNLLFGKLGMDYKCIYTTKSNIYDIRCYDKKDSLILLDYLYKDATIYLDRKKEKADILYQWLKQNKIIKHCLNHCKEKYFAKGYCKKCYKKLKYSKIN